MRKPFCDKKDTANYKGAWSKHEDERLIDHIRTHGEGCWCSLPLAAGLPRSGKSCRLRWMNHLKPDLKRGKFADDEEDLIIKLHALLGNRWSLIAGRLPGRTDNEVKNYWNCHLKKRLTNMGIDPNNHRVIHNFPRLQNQTNAFDDGATSAYRKSEGDNDELVSDARSSLQVDNYNATGLPDLNLDLMTPDERSF